MTAASKPEPAKLAGIYKPTSRPVGGLGICIYGRGGVGKTTILGTMPGKGLLIDIPQLEGGTSVLADHPTANIDVKPIEEWEDIDEVYWFLAKERHDYKWVAIDTITAMVELAKRKSIKERDLSMDPHMISQQEWGKVGRLCAELIFRFRKLPVHTVWLAQERKFAGAEGEYGDSTVGPDVSPATLAALLPSMLLVGRLSVERSIEGGWERHLRIGPSEHYTTKVRAKQGLSVPPVIRNPSISQILSFLFLNGARPEEVDENVLVIG